MGNFISSCYSKIIKPSHFERKVTSIVAELDLNPFQRKILHKRYIRQVSLYEKRTRNFGITYNAFRTTVTVGSILLPAFLSIQNNEDYSNSIYWATWGISIVITLCNGCIQLYSLDRNYITFSLIVEKLKTEGWKYFQCSGDYKHRTHKENFVSFCETIEKLKMRQVNKEIQFISKQKDDIKHDKDSIITIDDRGSSNTNLLHPPLSSIPEVANLKLMVSKMTKNTQATSIPDVSENILGVSENIPTIHISDADVPDVDASNIIISAENISAENISGENISGENISAENTPNQPVTINIGGSPV